ncbi:MAG: YbaB/EbfC family nucleoid-associated protein [Patescibacteria group bacterium]|jgi:DNA-binding protein YbaB
MANPFSQARDLMKLQGEVKKMQKDMESRKFIGESNKGFVKIYLNGTGEILDIVIDDILIGMERKVDLVSHIKDAYKDAQKKMSRDMAKDMDLSKLKNFMGV